MYRRAETLLVLEGHGFHLVRLAELQSSDGLRRDHGCDLSHWHSAAIFVSSCTTAKPSIRRRRSATILRQHRLGAVPETPQEELDDSASVSRSRCATCGQRLEHVEMVASSKKRYNSVKMDIERRRAQPVQKLYLRSIITYRHPRRRQSSTWSSCSRDDAVSLSLCAPF